MFSFLLIFELVYNFIESSNVFYRVCKFLFCNFFPEILLDLVQFVSYFFHIGPFVSHFYLFRLYISFPIWLISLVFFPLLWFFRLFPFSFRFFSQYGLRLLLALLFFAKTFNCSNDFCSSVRDAEFRVCLAFAFLGTLSGLLSCFTIEQVNRSSVDESTSDCLDCYC